MFVMIGGSHDNFSRGDMWLCDFTTKKLNWTKVRKLTALYTCTHSKRCLLSHVIKIYNPGHLECKMFIIKLNLLSRFFNMQMWNLHGVAIKLFELMIYFTHT